MSLGKRREKTSAEKNGEAGREPQLHQAQVDRCAWKSSDSALPTSRGSSHCFFLSVTLLRRQMKYNLTQQERAHLEEKNALN